MKMAQMIDPRELQDIRDLISMKHQLIQTAKIEKEKRIMQQKVRYERLQLPKRIAVGR